MKRAVAVLAATLILTSWATPASAGPDVDTADPAQADTVADVPVPPEDVARGLVYDDLSRPESTFDPCGDGYRLEGVEGIACTHGPDASPLGVDVTEDAPLVEVAREASTPAPDIYCDPNDTSPYRTQAIYAVSSDRTDRSATIIPKIGTWAGNVESVYAESAEFFGGIRHVRWVADSRCRLDVQKVVMSPSGDDSFSNTINEVRAAGHDRPDRKYLIWADSNVYCGVAMMYFDDGPSQTNVNNGSYSMYGRVDSACWGRTPSVEAHELMHNLGSVQPSAPHATDYGHCTDDADRMCYVDAPGTVVDDVCPASHEHRFDCNGDDYFNIYPRPGSYLATHWNTANSRFLVALQPKVDTVLDTFTRSLSDARTVTRHEFRTKGGTVDMAFVGTQKSGRTWRLELVDSSGRRVWTDTDVRRIDAGVILPAGDYTARVSGGRGRYFLNVDYPPGTYEADEILLKTFTRSQSPDRPKTHHRISTSGGTLDIAFVGLKSAGVTWRLVLRNDATGKVHVFETTDRRIDKVLRIPAGDYTFTLSGGSGRYFMNASFPAPTS